jgi:2,3-bisphosphoglycerate-dependent phosphoglycerate mutase
MKIYILRHEERTKDASFFSPLTKQGHKNAQNLVNTLEKLNINKIYCSPYIRTLQTIHPYSKKYNIPINVDYGLVEILHESIIPPKSYDVELPDYMGEYFNVNKSYYPLITNKDLEYPENDKKLSKRTKKIFKHIIDTNKYATINTNKHVNNILVVTHQGLCKNIINIKNKIDDYETGELSLIFDNYELCYKKVSI